VTPSIFFLAVYRDALAPYSQSSPPWAFLFQGVTEAGQRQRRLRRRSQWPR
jgi:hypothetical protein